MSAVREVYADFVNSGSTVSSTLTQLNLPSPDGLLYTAEEETPH
jgi:hypothetical protein